MIDRYGLDEITPESRDSGEFAGLEHYRTVLHSEDRAEGIDGLLGMAMTSIETGTATFELKTGAQHSNSLGIVHGGIGATMLDSAMACAIHSMLGAGDKFITVELKVNYIRAAHIEGEVLTARGKVVHMGRSIAVADGQIHNDVGQLIAHATTTCLVRRNRMQ